MTNLQVAVNNDTQDSPYGTSGVDWTDMDIANDAIIFSAGDAIVADGEAIPSQQEINVAGTIIHAVNEVEVAKCFLSDDSAGILKEINNYADNKRYVFAFDFDGATASEPVLELWDDDDLDTIALYSLGATVPNDSWWKGVVTTGGLPGASWAGSPLAGSANALELNDGNGALAVATTLYCNLKIKIPGGTVVSALEQPTLVCKYLSV